MGTDYRPEPTVFVIFGGAGDLSWRKLIPALHNLYLDNWLPEKFLVIGTGHRHTSDEDFRRHLREGVDKFSRRGKTTDEAVARLRGAFELHGCGPGSTGGL